MGGSVSFPFPTYFILSSMHLYVHVPFCKRRCSYCDFAIAVRKQVPGDEFVEAIKREFALRHLALSQAQGVETLYFGGGTPSLLSSSHVAALIRFFRGEIGFAERGGGGGVEVTMEVNPDDVMSKDAEQWLAAGVNRVSLGVQSLNPAVLQWMHRVHTGEDSLRAIRFLTAAGLPSLSVDVIFGLPETLGADPAGDLRRLLEHDVDHVSAYGLTVESGTPLAKWTSRGAVRHATDGAYADEFLQLHEMLLQGGFEHYEVSNYARPERRSRHNQAYWTGRRYWGLGPSAHSFGDGIRRWNVRQWAEYHRAVANGSDPKAGEEELSEGQLSLEHWYLGLRTTEGVPVPEGGDLPPQLRAAVDRGWLTVEGGKIRPTPEGWLRLDAIVASLTTSAESG